MFDSLGEPGLLAKMTSAQRDERAAVARRLLAAGRLCQVRMADRDALDRLQWCIDNWEAVAAEVGAGEHFPLPGAQRRSAGLGSAADFTGQAGGQLRSDHIAALGAIDHRLHDLSARGFLGQVSRGALLQRVVDDRGVDIGRHQQHPGGEFVAQDYRGMPGI